MTELQQFLTDLGVCRKAVEWVGQRDLSAAWAECERADWLLWLAARMARAPGWPPRTEVARAVADCVETVLRYVPPGDTRPADAIAAARAWADNPCEQTRMVAAYAYVAAAVAISDAAHPPTVYSYVIRASSHVAAYAADTDPFDASDVAKYVIDVSASDNGRICALIRARLSPGPIEVPLTGRARVAGGSKNEVA